jgi:hypothetical protein
MVIWMPALLVLFLALVGVANLWLARVELENALESSALAAVKQWGDANGAGGTLIPRRAGVAYASGNSLRGSPLTIGLNYDPISGGVNQNDECLAGKTPPSGNLIFGAIDDSNPGHVIFNAGLQPSCAAGAVLFDATASGQGNIAQDNAWGISFQCHPLTPPGLRIARVVIDLQPDFPTTDGVFDFGSGGPVLSDSLPAPIIHEHCSQQTFSQPDIVGFANPNAQIVFTPTCGTSSTLTIDFLPCGGDSGFAPGDRFRFGALTEGVSQGNGHDDGDGMGRDGVQVTVYFELGGVPLPPVTGAFFDNNTEGRNDCLCPPQVSPCDSSLIVHPALIPNLPCPATSSNDNNGQSFALISGVANRKFGVRAQAMAPVQPLGGLPFLGRLTEQCVQAKTTAVYDCATRRVRLIRIDEFVCPGP